MYTIKTNSQVLSFVALALVITYGVVVNKAFPYLGFAVAWSALTTALYWQKPYKDTFSHIAYVLSVMLSLCFFWRANPLLTFFNFIGMVGLTTVLAIKDDADKQPGLWRMLFSPITLFSLSMSTQVQYAAEISTDKLSVFLRKIKFQESFVSVLVTIVSLAIIVPLLAGSNPFFKNLLDETVALLNVMRLLEKIQALELTSWTIFQLGVFGFLLVAVPRAVAYMATQVRRKDTTQLNERSMTLPKFVIAAVLIVFFATQVQLYFASDAQLLAVGSTPSERTNEVFGQLSVVAGVILSLLYMFRSYKPTERKLTWILLVESVFLTMIAFSSVYQYAANFGFTFKRLWGLAVVFWLLAVLALYARTYWRRIASEYYLQSFLLLLAVSLIVVNVANFDYLIAHVHQPRTGAGIDYQYMQYQLSADARADLLLLNAFEAQAQQAADPSAASFALFNKNVVYGKMLTRQKQYRNLDLRTLNLGEFLAYRLTSHIDAEAEMSATSALQLGLEQQVIQASPEPVVVPTAP